jgi:hypothetical protein
VGDDHSPLDGTPPHTADPRSENFPSPAPVVMDATPPPTAAPEAGPPHQQRFHVADGMPVPIDDADQPADPQPRAAAPPPNRPLSGTGETIRLPQWDLPATSRSIQMHFSLVSQIDGLCYKCRGPGARISRDTLAPSADSAVCHVFGHEPWMSTGSCCGFYFCDFAFMPSVVAKVASDRGYGIFVVPVLPRAKPAIAVLQKGDLAGQWRYYGWFDYLMSKALLVLHLPNDAFLDLKGSPVRHPFGVLAVLAQFGHNGRMKALPRPEHQFTLSVIPALTGTKLDVRPKLTHRVSPIAWNVVPKARDDILPASPRFVVAEGVVSPAPLQSRWTSVITEFKDLASDFPCQHVAKLAVECLTDGVNTYKGTLDKPVLHKEPRRRNNVEELAKRATIMKEVSTDPQRIAGPFPSCPYETARVCPTDTREKDPYDPESDRLRLISDFSRAPKGLATGSTNALCWSPRLLSYHATADHIRDTLAWLFLCFGAGIVAWTADIPSCFRLNHLNATLLSLFVYKVVTEEHGTEWFADLATPFGWTPAEWGWQCILALILWALHKAALDAMIAYVDNFFLLAHPSSPGTDVPALFGLAEAVFKRLNIPLHERMSGTKFKGLGWMWDTSSATEPPSMICADDKHAHLCRQLPTWAAATELTVQEVESIIGFLTWISAGFHIGRPHMSALRSELASHNVKAESCQYNHKKKMPLGKRSREALYFWNKFIPKWDKRCQVYLDFGPMAAPQVLWRVDASTEWGCGAFMWPIGEASGFYILHEWTGAERDEAFVVERVSTGILEAMAAVRCAKAFAKLCAGKRVLMEMDNEALAHGIRKYYSKHGPMNNLIRGVCELATVARVNILAAHIKGANSNTCPNRTSTITLPRVVACPASCAQPPGITYSPPCT